MYELSALNCTQIFMRTMDSLKTTRTEFRGTIAFSIQSECLLITGLKEVLLGGMHVRYHLLEARHTGFMHR